LHCRLTHQPSRSEIATDAPKDNNGKGEAFSPTDLVAAALGACMLTVMGIAAMRHQINLEGSKVDVEKVMIAEPTRRIGSITVVLNMAKGIPEAKRSMLEATALACPVNKSLHPDVRVPVTFIW
jgi:putative redox protein